MTRSIAPPILAILLLAGCNDAGLTKFNAEPTAEITSHGPDAAHNPPSIYEGALVTFAGEVSDPDDTFEDLSVVWYLGDEILCEATPADALGGSTCEGRTDLDSDSVRLVVSDPENKTATATVQLDIVPTEAPDALISAPLETGRYYADLRITFEGLVTDTEDSPDALGVTWESDLDGDLGNLIGVYLGWADSRRLARSMGNDRTAAERTRRCVVFYHLGVHHLLKHELPTARRYFGKAVATNAASVRQFKLAARALARLRGNN